MLSYNAMLLFSLLCIITGLLLGVLLIMCYGPPRELHGIVQGGMYRDVVWFRVIGYGLCIERTSFTFSEREGYRRYLPLLCGWRVSVLKP